MFSVCRLQFFGKSWDQSGGLQRASLEMQEKGREVNTWIGKYQRVSYVITTDTVL